MKNMAGQMFRFGIAGGICFLIDYGLMILMTEVLQIHFMISGAISFGISTIINYLFSIKFVFGGRTEREQKRTCIHKDFILFILMSAAGLLINQAVLGLGSLVMHISYKLSKIAATAVVMVYNFITRKILLEKQKT